MTQGWLAADPARSGLVYVTRRGDDALAACGVADDAAGADEAQASAAEGTPPGDDDAQQHLTPSGEPLDGEPTAHRPRGRIRSLFYDPWTVGIGTAVIAGIVLAFALPRVVGDDDDDGAAPVRSSSPATTSRESSPSDVQRFTVQNDVRRGAWALSAPTLPRLYSRNERPRTAKRWLPDGTVVSLECAKRGTPYAVILNGENVQWEWWGRLEDGTWLPMAPLKEALQDGAQGLPTCP